MKVENNKPSNKSTIYEFTSAFIKEMISFIIFYLPVANVIQGSRLLKVIRDEESSREDTTMSVSI